LLNKIKQRLDSTKKKVSNRVKFKRDCVEISIIAERIRTIRCSPN
jgi:hypothetical protein